MTQPAPRKLTLPWHILVLDILGALLAARGIYLYVSGEGGVLFIVAGFLLMAPLAIHLVNQAPGKRPGGCQPQGVAMDTATFTLVFCPWILSGAGPVTAARFLARSCVPCV